MEATDQGEYAQVYEDDVEFDDKEDVGEVAVQVLVNRQFGTFGFVTFSKLTMSDFLLDEVDLVAQLSKVAGAVRNNMSERNHVTAFRHKKQ